jgi:CheY-like chemotaxis protein
MTSLPRRFDKTLLVCSEVCEQVERSLAAAGCIVTKVADGARALDNIRREIFDLAILVSTGKEMDVIETVLNLRDIRPSMPTILVMDPATSEAAGAEPLISQAIPDIAVLTIAEFKTHLDRI